MRKITSISTGSNYTYAICEDGTAWEYCGSQWRSMPTIQQDPVVTKEKQVTITLEQLEMAYKAGLDGYMRALGESVFDIMAIELGLM